ncbi:peptidoglycan-binding protein [Streptomyces sp. NPDC005727]|uniref:peptidoglycan-binding domain-containing protein n=1 Tax=Streptomyces sp. NPDC005727 TaxID=3157053 RepID=UPI0033EBB6FC
MGDPALDPSNDCEEGDCPQPGSETETGPKAETGPPSTTADPAPVPALESSLISTGPRTWPLVQSGAQGDTVAAVQLLLTAHGYRTNTDAAFGPRTTAQVRSFQRDNSLDDDGIVGPDTWHALIINMRSGDRGPAVTAVQRLLAVHGHSAVDDDGTFGTSTAQAVRAFQEERHLAADSVVGPDTWATLLSEA